MKNLLQKLVGAAGRTSTESAGRQLAVAAFGKHPAWADFEGICVDTEALARVKQAFLDGVEEQKKQWPKLEGQKRLDGFNHTFLWLRSGHALLGLLWDSRDSLGRQDLMGLCVDSEGVSFEWLLGTALPELERLRAACQAATTTGQVVAVCQTGRDRLQEIHDQAAVDANSAAQLQARQRFFARPELGPDRLGLLRILHECGPAVTMPVPRSKSDINLLRDLRPRHARVPLAGDSSAEALGLWAAFFRSGVAEALPILVISRTGANWLDVIIGRAAGESFFCLQASSTALPLATDTAYDIPPELRVRLQEFESKFLASPPGSGKPRTAPPASPSTSLAAPDLEQHVENRSGGKVWVLLGVGAAVLLSAAALLLLRGGIDHSSARARSRADNPATGAALEERFLGAQTAAQAAEISGNFTNALTRYQAALNMKPNDAQVAAKIEALTARAEAQIRTAEEHARQERLAAEQFEKTLALAKAAEQEGNLTNALALYQAAQRLKPDDAELSAKVSKLGH